MTVSRLARMLTGPVVVMLLGQALAGGAGPGPDRVIEHAGRRDGLCVVVHPPDAARIVDIVAKSDFVVHAIHQDAAAVEHMREAVDRRGIYGRASIERAAMSRLPYVENLVNVLIVYGAHDLLRRGVPAREFLRVVAPYGTAWLECASTTAAAKLRSALQELVPGDAITGPAPGWICLRKPYPDEMDEWTHFRHGAEGNMVARDSVVGPPRHVRWVCGPTWQRHHALTPGTTVMVGANGRLFYIQDESPIGFAGLPDQWRLVARDAFNGKALWKRDMGPWGDSVWSWWTGGHGARGNHPYHVNKRLVASKDRVFVTLGYNAPVSALDPATGETLLVYEGTEYTDEMVCRDGVLYVSVNDRPQKALPGKGFSTKPTAKNTSKKTIRAIEPVSGKTLWKAGPHTGIAGKNDRLSSMKNVQLVASEKGVFLTDEDALIGLDLKTGRERFRTPVRLSKKPVVFYHRGRLFIANKDVLSAYDAETGEQRWQGKCGSLGGTDVPGIFGVGDLVWVGDKVGMEMIAFHCDTGEEKRRLSIAKLLADAGHHHRCYPNKSTVKYLITGRRAAEFTNYRTGEVTLNHWARGQCRYGLMPSNGLLYKLPDPCGCYVQAKLLGFYALASEETAQEFFRDADDIENPLQKGRAFGAVAEEQVSPASEWPVFRHDPLRSSSVETEIAGDIKPLWDVEIGGRLSPPVIGGGRVCVSAVDEHKVHAFDERNGAALWTYIADGRVDSPPSIHGGMALFGSAAGWVYCLRASDGELVWRFRAAPHERNIMAYGQIESAWPVHGSVLVAGGVVYCTAGRSSFVDGGIYLYALDVETGK
ncbi:MAG: outer membrane protein assembly factor BamB family protein, partial [Planctomycetota bacterium]